MRPMKTFYSKDCWAEDNAEHTKQGWVLHVERVEREVTGAIAVQILNKQR